MENSRVTVQGIRKLLLNPKRDWGAFRDGDHKGASKSTAICEGETEAGETSSPSDEDNPETKNAVPTAGDSGAQEITLVTAPSAQQSNLDVLLNS